MERDSDRGGLARDGHLHPLQEAFVQEGLSSAGLYSRML